jgi:CheY-like chemotaxis protein
VGVQRFHGLGACLRKGMVKLQSSERLKILVVDDDPLVLMGTVDMLEDLGHDVIQAGSGRDALQLLQDSAGFDLVLSDQSMPQMTGAQLAQRIREQFPELPIVLATGYADLPPELPAGIRRLGKPFSQNELAQTVAVTTGRA